MTEPKYTVAYNSHFGDQFLCALESHCCGTRFIGHFCVKRSSAMPMSYDQAKKLRDLLQAELNKIRLQVVPYPAPREEVQHEN